MRGSANEERGSRIGRLDEPSHGKTLLDGSEDAVEERVHFRADLVRDVTNREEGWRDTREVSDAPVNRRLTLLTVSLLRLLELREEMPHTGREEARSSVLIAEALRIVGSEMGDERDNSLTDDCVLGLAVLEDVVADHVVVGVHELRKKGKNGGRVVRLPRSRFERRAGNPTDHLSVVEESFEDEQTSVYTFRRWCPETADGLVEHPPVNLIPLLLISSRPRRLDLEATGDEKS